MSPQGSGFGESHGQFKKFLSVRIDWPPVARVCPVGFCRLSIRRAEHLCDSGADEGGEAEAEHSAQQAQLTPQRLRLGLHLCFEPVDDVRDGHVSDCLNRIMRLRGVGWQAVQQQLEGCLAVRANRVVEGRRDCLRLGSRPPLVAAGVSAPLNGGQRQ